MEAGLKSKVEPDWFLYLLHFSLPCQSSFITCTTGFAFLHSPEHFEHHVADIIYFEHHVADIIYCEHQIYVADVIYFAHHIYVADIINFEQ